MKYGPNSKRFVTVVFFSIFSCFVVFFFLRKSFLAEINTNLLKRLLLFQLKLPYLLLLPFLLMHLITQFYLNYYCCDD